jgi:hypothetical protein
MWSYKTNKQFENITYCEQDQQLQVLATLIAITRKITDIEMQDVVRDLKLYNEFIYRINIKCVTYTETYYIYIYKAHIYKGSTM